MPSAPRTRYVLGDMFYQSTENRQTILRMPSAAVLIEGNDGKDWRPRRFIENILPRCDRAKSHPFVAVNQAFADRWKQSCLAMRKGVHRQATRGRAGLFERLRRYAVSDEIMKCRCCCRLRPLRREEVTGGHQPNGQMRVISATHRNLEEDIRRSAVTCFIGRGFTLNRRYASGGGYLAAGGFENVSALCPFFLPHYASGQSRLYIAHDWPGQYSNRAI